MATETGRPKDRFEKIIRGSNEYGNNMEVPTGDHRR